MGDLQESASTAVDEQHLEDLASLVMDETKKKGASAAEMTASLDEGLSVRARLGEVDTVEHSRDREYGRDGLFWSEESVCCYFRL